MKTFPSRVVLRLGVLKSGTEVKLLTEHCPSSSSCLLASTDLELSETDIRL